MNIALPLFDHRPSRSPTVPLSAPVEANSAGRLVDSHGRTIRDLRLSVTDRCNFRCIYCMDPGVRFLPKRQLLRLEEYLRIVRVCVRLGIERVRITGGEPVLYPELDRLIESLGKLPLADLAMTTNGSLVDDNRAAAWSAAGLRRITLSLDSLRPQRVAAITRSGATLGATRDAIAAARRAQLDPIKVNAVIIRGLNDDEVADFAGFARDHDVDVRLIEFMPLDSACKWRRELVVPAKEMLDHIGRRHTLVPLGRDDPHSTALNFAFADGSTGRVGVVAAVTRPFCGACSRLRITADGKVRPCLFSRAEWDLKPLLRAARPDTEIVRFLIDATWTKPPGHAISSSAFIRPGRSMSMIGG